MIVKIKSVIDTIFYMSCWAGLIWQVLQISFLYFKFDVTSQISIIMPEKYVSTATALNICMIKYSLVKKSYQKLSKLRSSFVGIQPPFHTNSEMFRVVDEETIGTYINISTNPNQLLDGSKLMDSIEFIYDRFSCTQIQNYRQKGKKFFIKTDKIIGFGLIFVQIYFDYPNVNYDRLRAIPRLNYPDVFLNSHSYFIHKLEGPFSDNCFNYKNFGYFDQETAINHCVNDILMSSPNNYKDMIYVNIPINRNNYSASLSKFKPYPKYPYSSQDSDPIKYCEDKLFNADCHKEHVFTKEQIRDNGENSNNMTALSFFQKSDFISYEIQSSPSIDHIEYVTYIFGAIGTWLGFSFMNCNPVQLIDWYFNRKKQEVKPVVGLGNEQMFHLSRSFVMKTNSDIIKLYQRMNRFEATFHDKHNSTREKEWYVTCCKPKCCK